MHCTVVPCPAPDMGAVGYSANDPIFWAHHANIDRMWDCWTSLGNKNPQNPEYLNKTFSFINADGNLVTNAVADLFNGRIQFDYVYQQASNCARPVVVPEAVASPAVLSPAAVESVRMKLAAPALLGSAKDHAINADVTRRRLTLAGGGRHHQPHIRRNRRAAHDRSLTRRSREHRSRVRSDDRPRRRERRSALRSADESDDRSRGAAGEGVGEAVGGSLSVARGASNSEETMKKVLVVVVAVVIAGAHG